MDDRTRPSTDRIGCDGAGLCAQLLPELVSLDEWGYPIVRSGAVRRRCSTTPIGRSTPARSWRCASHRFAGAPARRPSSLPGTRGVGRIAGRGDPRDGHGATAPDYVTEPTGSPAETPSHDSPHRSRPQA